LRRSDNPHGAAYSVIFRCSTRYLLIIIFDIAALIPAEIFLFPKGGELSSNDIAQPGNIYSGRSNNIAFSAALPQLSWDEPFNAAGNGFGLSLVNSL